MNSIPVQDRKEGKELGFRALCCALALLLGAVAPVAAAESQKAKKKPRFELTEYSLRDRKTNVEWSLQKDFSPVVVSWYKANEYADAMNRDRLSGYRDWRLPTREELLSLRDYARDRGFDGSSMDRAPAKALHEIGLVNIERAHYWSSTENLYNDSMAWAVDLGNGTMEAIEKKLYENAIVVRTFD